MALIVSLSSGLALGVNVFVAQQIGKHREESLPGILRSSLMLAILIGLAGLILGQFFSRSVLDLLRTPQNILESATRYLRIYFLGYPFILLYDFGAAILRAKGDSRSPFLLLILAGAVNIALNLLFVAVFHLGVAGVATATCLSNIVSAAGTLWYLAKPFSLSVPHRAAGQPEPHLRPNASLHLTLSHWLSILKTGIPSAIQGAVFCFANLFVQAGVNRFGATAIAGSTIAMNFEYFTYYVITAFAQTATTFVSQNWAAGQKERCRRIFRLCLGFCLATSLLILESLTLFRAHVSGLFSPDPDVIRYACARILYILPLEPLCTLYEIPAGFLRGTGHAVYPAAATILGTCALRILWICTIFRTHPKLEILYVAFPLSWILTTVLVLAGFLYYKNSQLHDI